MVKHWIHCCYYCIAWVPSFCLICIKPQFKHFHFLRSFRSLEVVRGHKMVKHWICCCFCIPWVPSFRLICIKAIVEIYSICGGHQRSLEVIRDHQKVTHWICCYYCIPWIPCFRLICIKPQLKHFHFWRSFRLLEVVRGHQKVKHWIC